MTPASHALAHAEKSPYLGLRPFEAHDAPLFFGRSRETDLLAANLRTSRTSLVYGASGVGKSSLLRAGLLPALKKRWSAPDAESDDERETTEPVFFSMSRTDPVPGLVSAIATATRTPDTDGLSFLEVVERSTERVDRLLVVLDQFEEYLAFADTAERDPFADDFLRVVMRREMPVHFMIAMREDSIAKLDRFRARARDLLSNPIRIEPLDPSAASEAIHGPLTVFNQSNGTSFKIEPELEGALITAAKPGMLDFGVAGRGGLDIKDRGQEAIEAAYLQLALATIWRAERRAGSDVMRVATFERLGSLRGVVRRHLNGIMDEFTRREQVIAAAAFRFLVSPSGMKVPYSAWDLGELTEFPADEIEPVLERLSREHVRIVRPLAPSPRGDRRFEIYHDRLAEPVLAWSARSDAGKDRLGTFRWVTGVTGTLAAVAAIVALFTNGQLALVAGLGATSVVYLVIALVPAAARIFVKSMAVQDEQFERVLLALGLRRRARTRDS